MSIDAGHDTVTNTIIHFYHNTIYGCGWSGARRGAWGQRRRAPGALELLEDTAEMLKKNLQKKIALEKRRNRGKRGKSGGRNDGVRWQRSEGKETATETQGQ